MRLSLRVLRQIICVTAFLGAAAGASARAQVAAELPEEPRQRLEKLDQVVLGKQRELFAARQRGDQAAVDRLRSEFDALQRQRREAVERLGPFGM